MCETASFWHNPVTGDIRVWNLSGHADTSNHFGLSAKYWREGHYLPDGTIECRVLDTDPVPETACNERLRQRFPTFWDFLQWALEQPLRSSLDLNYCTLPAWFRFPEYYAWSINLNRCTLQEGLKLPRSTKGSLHLIGCNLPDGLRLPEFVGYLLEIRNCIPPASIRLPDFVDDWLDFEGSTIPANMQLPKHVGGHIDMRFCTVLEGFVVPEHLQKKVIWW